MNDRFIFDVTKGKLRLKAAKRRDGAPRDPVAHLWRRVGTQRLLSWPDAANSRNLQEETRLILSTLTEDEQDVLRMRFGIGQAGHCSVEEIARRSALESVHVQEIEAQALRKLRHPGGRFLKSVGRR